MIQYVDGAVQTAAAAIDDTEVNVDEYVSCFYSQRVGNDWSNLAAAAAAEVHSWGLRKEAISIVSKCKVKQHVLM